MEDSEDYIHSPQRVSQHVFRSEAAEAAIALHRKYAFETDYILDFELNSDFDFLEWCQESMGVRVGRHWLNTPSYWMCPMC